MEIKGKKKIINVRRAGMIPLSRRSGTRLLQHNFARRRYENQVQPNIPDTDAHKVFCLHFNAHRHTGWHGAFAWGKSVAEIFNVHY
jgi:hypothetical protein